MSSTDFREHMKKEQAKKAALLKLLEEKKKKRLLEEQSNITENESKKLKLDQIVQPADEQEQSEDEEIQEGEEYEIIDMSEGEDDEERIFAATNLLSKSSNSQPLPSLDTSDTFETIAKRVLTSRLQDYHDIRNDDTYEDPLLHMEANHDDSADVKKGEALPEKFFDNLEDEVAANVPIVYQGERVDASTPEEVTFTPGLRYEEREDEEMLDTAEIPEVLNAEHLEAIKNGVLAEATIKEAMEDSDSDGDDAFNWRSKKL